MNCFRQTFKNCIPIAIGIVAVGSLAFGEMNKDQLIRYARQTVGSEEALNGVVTLTYVGKIEEMADGRKGTIRMVLKKPMKQRLEVVIDGVKEVTAVNGSEGWLVRYDEASGESDLKIMDYLNVERMLINTWENLNFFSEPKDRFAKTKYIGEVEHRGRPAYQMETHYLGGTRYIRYFDKETKELISSLTERGLETVESGMIESGGLKFPRKIDAFREGKRVHTVRFDEIIVNDPVSDVVFDFPIKGFKP